jgi:hypothetical protein
MFYIANCLLKKIAIILDKNKKNSKNDEKMMKYNIV